MDFDMMSKDQLIQELDKLTSILDSLQEVVFEADSSGRLLFANRRAFEFFRIPERENFSFEEINIFDWVLPESLEQARQSIAEMIHGKPAAITEYILRRQDGTAFPAIVHSFPIWQDGQLSAIRGVIMDITDRRRLDDELQYISVHDPLTGLFNRSYFEIQMNSGDAEMARPIGMIVCDVDGLKLINDTLGHDAGDALLQEASAVLKSCFRQTDIVARIGGDEFAVILPCCDDASAQMLFNRLKEALDVYNNGQVPFPLLISMGYAVTDEKLIGIKDLFRQADNNMYREKLQRSQSIRSRMLEKMLKILEARHIIRKEQTQRLGSSVHRLAADLDVSPEEYKNLRLFAQFRDIGKIGIPDEVLLKPGSLSEDERSRMQLHCEIGYRIALTWDNLNPIADWILKHHEWWDGGGYPLGLRGTEIPLVCRILAVAEAYDAMTYGRPHRRAMSREEALFELKCCAGSQFDPAVVQAFLNLIRGMPDSSLPGPEPVAPVLHK